MAFAPAILIIVLVLYSLKISGYLNAWKKYPEFIPSEDDPVIRASIVVPFRNEKAAIGGLLKSLASQSYPLNLYEVIVVDDHSVDGSDRISEDFCNKHSGFRLVTSEGTGKKAALLTGIRRASNELIISTDADCVMGHGWLNTICDFRRKMGPDMIIGITGLVNKSGWFSGYQQAELMSLVAAGAAAAVQGKAVFCSGANLAFSRDLVTDADDPLESHIASGDDTFLLHYAKRLNKKILVLRSPVAIVRTTPCLSFREYLEQRTRWASKARSYSDRDIIYLALLVIVANIAVTISFFMLVSGLALWLFPLLAGMKFFTDYFFMRNFMKGSLEKIPAAKFILYSLVYPFITVYAAFAGLFGRFSWKGRNYGG